MKKNILIIAANPTTSTTTGWPVGFWASEVTHPYQKLTDFGYDVTIASPKGGKLEMDALSDPNDASGYSSWDAVSKEVLATDSFKQLLENTPALADLKIEDFDAIIVAGGQAPMFNFEEDVALHGFFASFYETGKVTAALCHGTALLRYAKGQDGELIVKGKRVTGFTNGEEDEADRASEESFDTLKARDDTVKVSSLNRLKQHLERRARNMDNSLALVRLELYKNPLARVDGDANSLTKLTETFPKLQMNSLLDKTELLLLAEKNGWRLENIADGLGIDANVAFSSISGEIHRLDDGTKHEVKRAIAKELIEFITTGTIRRGHPPKYGREVSPPPIEFTTLVTRKTNAQGEVDKYKSRMVLRGDKEKEGLHFRLEDVRTVGVETAVQRLYELTSITLGRKPIHKDVRAAYLNTKKLQAAYVWVPVGITGLLAGECAALGTEVYGSRTAAKAWSDRSSAVHLAAGLVPVSESAPHLCKKKLTKKATL